MAVNRFEDSRIAAGTLRPGAQEIGETAVKTPDESRAISRDDVRDGYATETANPNSNQSKPRLIAGATSLVGSHVRNKAGEDLGKLEQIMLDLSSARIGYAVLSVGGFLGIGAKMVAVPWSALAVEEVEQGPRLMLDVDRETLEHAPGFEKDDWPDMADPAFEREIHQHYGQAPWRDQEVTDSGDYVGDNLQRNRSVEYEHTTAYRPAGR
jgi:sporulation protein YlmC with PRC-barrel domain